MPTTAYIIKFCFGADNQHYHPHQPRAFRQESTPQSAPNHIREPLPNTKETHSIK